MNLIAMQVPDPMRIVSTTLAVILVVGFVACDSGESPDAGVGPEAVAAAISEGADDPAGLRFTETEAACVADGLVENLDASRLTELGFDGNGSEPDLSEPPLTQAEADQVFGLYRRCLDLVAQLADLFSADPSLSPDDADCMAEEYSTSGLLQDALLRADFDAELNAQIDAAIADARTACGVE